MDVRLAVLRDIFADDLYKFGRAEGGLIDDRGVFRHSGLHRIIQLPALGVLHAVDKREVDALLRFKIGFLVRVLRGDDHVAAGLVFVDLGYNVRDDGLRLGGAERLIDEVLLHIDDKENVHGFSLRVGCGGFLADFRERFGFERVGRFRGRRREGRCTGRGSAWCLLKYTKYCVTMQHVFVRSAPCCPEKAKKIRRKKRRIFLN